MRIILFFDLPVETSADVKAYTKFRKFLIKEGFIMMQKSVYTKLTLNNTYTNLYKKRLEKNVPSNGLVQILVITEKQFAGIENIIGESKTNAIDTTERTIFL